MTLAAYRDNSILQVGQVWFIPPEVCARRKPRDKFRRIVYVSPEYVTYSTGADDVRSVSVDTFKGWIRNNGAKLEVKSCGLYE